MLMFLANGRDDALVYGETHLVIIPFLFGVSPKISISKHALAMSVTGQTWLENHDVNLDSGFGKLSKANWLSWSQWYISASRAPVH